MLKELVGTSSSITTITAAFCFVVSKANISIVLNETGLYYAPKTKAKTDEKENIYNFKYLLNWTYVFFLSEL